MPRLLPVDLPRALLIGLSVITLVFLFVIMSTSTASFGTHNHAWDGTSSVRDQASDLNSNTVLATTTADYERADPESSVAVILSPDNPYTSGETDRLRSFVQSGGLLVVADDFGSETNRLLEDIGAEARIDGRPLRDEQRNYRSSALPIATETAAHPLTDGVTQLSLNHPSVVQPDGARVLVRSSPFAYLDENRNGTLDDDERLARYPVVTVETIDRGNVLVVSDPSVFINAMVDRPDNSEFTRALLSSRDTVVFDQSHTGDLPPLTTMRVTVKRSQLLQAVVGFAGIAVVGLMRWRRN